MSTKPRVPLLRLMWVALLSLFLATFVITTTTAASNGMEVHEEGSPRAEAQHVVFAATSTLLPDAVMVNKVQKALVTIRTKYPQVKDIKNSGLWKIGKVVVSSYFDDQLFNKIEKKFGSLAYMNVVEHKNQKQQIATVITRKPYNAILLSKQLEDGLNVTATPDFNQDDNNSVQYNPEDSTFNFFRGNHYWRFSYDEVSSNVTLENEDDLDNNSDFPAPNEPSNTAPVSISEVSNDPPIFYQLKNGTMAQGTVEEIEQLVKLQEEFEDAKTTSENTTNGVSMMAASSKNGIGRQASSPEVNGALSITLQRGNRSAEYGSMAEMQKLMIVDEDKYSDTETASGGIILHLKNGAVTPITSEELRKRLTKQGNNDPLDTIGSGFQTYVELQNDTLLHVNQKELENELSPENGMHKTETPITDQEEAEQLLLEQISCNELLPDVKLVDKIKDDLAKIRNKFPEVTNIRHHGVYELGKIIAVKIADNTLCKTLNESQYGPIKSFDIFQANSKGIIAREIITFTKSYNPRVLALRLRNDLKIPAMSLIQPNLESKSLIRILKDKEDNCAYTFIPRGLEVSQKEGGKNSYSFKIDSKTAEIKEFSEDLNIVECQLTANSTSI